MNQSKTDRPTPAPLNRRGDFRRAWRALRAVIADPERTDLVVEFLNAVGGNGDVRAFQRFRAHPTGQRLLAERPSLPDTLADLPSLSAMPPGSLGRAYA